MMKISMLLFSTACTFYSQMRPGRVKAETNKTIVFIDQISDCQAWLKPAKTPCFTPQASALPGFATPEPRQGA
jgi:hypothetical protein